MGSERAPSSGSDDDEPGGGVQNPSQFAGAMIVEARTTTDEIERLAALLAAKDNELRTLQKTHDEYVKSSCEYEKELETEVERCEHKTQALELQLRTLEESKATLQATLAQTQHDLAAAAAREHALAAHVNEMKWTIQRLEQTNDELETATRVAQASIDELQHRVDTLTEENVFLVQEKEDALAAAMTTIKEPEARDPEPTVEVTAPATGSTSVSISEKRKAARLPDVVESCLHITCSHEHCQAAIAKAANKGSATTTKPRKSFYARLRQWASY